MFCKKCGSQIPDNSAFCPECGAAVSAAQAEPKAAEQPSNAPEAPAAKPAMNKHRLIGIIAFGAAALGVIIIFVAILAGGGWKKTANKFIHAIEHGDVDECISLINEDVVDSVIENYYDSSKSYFRRHISNFVDSFIDVEGLEIIRSDKLHDDALDEVIYDLNKYGGISRKSITDAVLVLLSVEGDEYVGDIAQIVLVKINGDWCLVAGNWQYGAWYLTDY